jgi:hypothetical protein
LGDVLGLGARADHAQNQVEDTVAVLPDYLIEGFFIPPHQSRNQKSLGQAHLKRRPRTRGAQATRVGRISRDGRGQRGRENGLHISIDSVAAEKFHGAVDKHWAV